jgi:hypothetical protein
MGARDLILFACVAANGCGAGAPRVLYQGVSDTISFRAVAVDASVFSRSFLEGQARRFARETRGRRLAKLVIFTDENDAETTLFGKSRPNTGYASWLPQHQRSAKSALPVADVIVVNGVGTLRFRDQGGTIHSVKLDDRDPLAVAVGRESYRIVDVLFPRFLPWSVGNQGPEVCVYATTTSELGVDRGAEFTRAVSALFGTSRLLVSVRHDIWFIADGLFPYYFRLSEIVDPPTYDEYYSSKELSCRTDSGPEPRCIVFNPVDEAGLRPTIDRR